MNRMRSGVALWMAAAMGMAASAWANNLWVTNTTVVTGMSPGGTTIVQFDIGWDNSWRHAFNHDAAWVFFKFKIEGDASEGWSHATLAGSGTNPANYSVGTGTPMELVVPPDRVGLFVRLAPGDPVAGSVAVTNVRAVVHLADSGISPSASIRVQTMAIEMVYVAEGAFWAGDGLSSGTFTPTWINNSDPTVTAVWSDEKYQGGRPHGQTAPTNAWPNGFSAFYCMKYELTQGQYADFLNALTDVQAAARAYVGGSHRHTISVSAGVYSASRRDRACNWLSWDDCAAYAVWSGLRPMTELEYEKACRGPVAYLPGEYAWGTDTIRANTSLQISGSENGTETVLSDVSAGASYYGWSTHTGGDGGLGPLRAGIFATNGSSRVTAGASYWGIMELSGNVGERMIAIHHANGRAFAGLHGDGTLASGGVADKAALKWPASDGHGTGFKNCAWYQIRASDQRVSDRSGITDGPRPDRYHPYGFRAVRSAP